MGLQVFLVSTQTDSRFSNWPATLLMPVSARRALNDLPDELWTKVNIEFYLDPADAVFKSLVE